MTSNYINWVVEPSEKKIELKEKDKRLLEYMSNNSNASLSEIGRFLRLSKVAVFNRIKNLEKLKVISGYTCFINFAKIGFDVYNLFIRINSGFDEKKRFLENLNKFDFVQNIIQLSGGRYNFIVRIYSKYEDLNNQIDKIISLDKNIISLDLLQIYDGVYFNKSSKKNLFILEKGNEVISDFERELLYELAKNSRQKIVDLSFKLKSSPKKIIGTIKRLKERGILHSLIIQINPFVYGHEAYILIAETNSRINQEKFILHLSSLFSQGVLLHFQNPNIFGIHIVSDLMDLIKIERSLNKFSDNIKSYEFVRIELQAKYHFFPEYIYKKLGGDVSI